VQYAVSSERCHRENENLVVQKAPEMDQRPDVSSKMQAPRQPQRLYQPGSQEAVMKRIKELSQTHASIEVARRKLLNIMDEFVICNASVLDAGLIHAKERMEDCLLGFQTLDVAIGNLQLAIPKAQVHI
jgi:hypothetical protein